jgi:hypothetical protein
MRVCVCVCVCVRACVRVYINIRMSLSVIPLGDIRSIDVRFISPTNVCLLHSWRAVFVMCAGSVRAL